MSTEGIDLAVRIGINSGEVVVGSIGDEGEMEYTAIGHTVGLAQRMESMAERRHRLPDGEHGGARRGLLRARAPSASAR